MRSLSFDKKDNCVLDLSRPHTVQFPTILQSVKTLKINTHLSPLNTENSMIPVLPAASLLDCPSLSRDQQQYLFFSLFLLLSSPSFLSLSISFLESMSQNETLNATASLTDRREGKKELVREEIEEQ